MSGPPKNFVESFLPMIIVYAMIGHEAFRYPATKPRVGWSILYTFVMITTSAPVLYLTFYYADSYVYETVEEKLFFLICKQNIIIVLCTGSLAWFHYKRRKRIMERITAVDETLTELGADCEHARTYRAGIVCLVVHVALAFTLTTIDSIWIIDKFSLLDMFWTTTVLHFPFHVANFILMKCSMTMRVMAVRFRITNKILEEILHQNGRKDSHGNATFTRRTSHRMVQIQIASRKTSQKRIVQIIKQVHLELCSISEGLNTIYGAQLVIQLGAYFVFLTVLGYDLYVNYVNPAVMNRSRRICGLWFWFFVHFIKVVFVNHMSENVTREAYGTRAIVHELNMINHDYDFKDEVRQFSYQMLQNTLSFTPMGLLTLGYGLVRSVLGTVATYIVILIQTNIIPEFMIVNKK